jgi:hypothetical protein
VPRKARRALKATCSRPLTVSMFVTKVLADSKNSQCLRRLYPFYGFGESGRIGIPLFGLGESGRIGMPLFGLGESGRIGIPLLGLGESGRIGIPLA